MNVLDIYPNIMEAPVEIRMSRAKASDTPPDVLEQLSKDSFWFVRDLTASNINTPLKCLAELSVDPDFRIRVDAQRTLKTIENNQSKPSLDEQIQIASNKTSPQTQSNTVKYEISK